MKKITCYFLIERECFSKNSICVCVRENLTKNREQRSNEEKQAKKTEKEEILLD